MPTYQYRCTECGRELEVVQKFTDPTLTECEECRGALRKVYNAVGVVFKGSGFYRTDSRKADGAAGGTRAAEKSSSDKASGDKGSGDKTPAGSGTGSGAGNGSASGSSGTAAGSAGKTTATASSTAA
ncbi:FmdB family zinc ribbon protein [Microlunatus ginsengisoli]|uniref:Putative regulatory protein FmdB zinc ribbon domain-containing protein n=1 Tax=Microlunatus ginsengisoli TaxID=363863 RepID=A0ABP7AV38_9ACTN